MTYEEAKLFIFNFKNYEETFSKTTLEQCLSRQDIRNWTIKKEVDINHYRGEYDKYPKIQDKHFAIISRSIYEKGIEYTGYYQAPCETYLIPNNYQTKESGFFLDCIHTEMPELKHFNFQCYHFDRLNTLIFLETDLQINSHNIPLYIPIDKLIERNIEKIVEYHTKYHVEYYNPLKAGKSWSVTKEQLQEWQNISLDVLNQSIVKNLFEILKNPEKYKNIDNALTIDDFRALMEGGITAMRESIEAREQKKIKIFHIVREFQKKVNEEYISFKNKCIKETIKDPEFSFMRNFEIYTKMNLFMFFCNQESLELWKYIEGIQEGSHNITEDELLHFLQLDEILETLYRFETEYDSEIHTDTWDNICFMIEEYIDEYER
jgi:hypothetical protein